MALKSYVICTADGDVEGGSVAFDLATTYAGLYPQMRVLAIDMGRQASFSRLLFGGGSESEAVLDHLHENQPVAKTIAGYLTTALEKHHLSQVHALAFLVRPCVVNRTLPYNVQLLSGDPDLRSIATTNWRKPADSDRGSSCVWKLMSEGLRKLMRDIHELDDSDLTVFTDVDPELSVFTELVMETADSVILTQQSSSGDDGAALTVH